MRKRRPSRKQPEGKALYDRANVEWSRNRLRSAFRLFLASARLGNGLAQAVVGQFYDCGTGVKRNKDAALYWYRRAHRHGGSFVTNNIGCIWRDRGNLDRALLWFRRAVQEGDLDANLNIAHLYLRQKRDPQNAIPYLRKVSRSPVITTAAKPGVTLGSKEEAERLLKRLTKKPKPDRNRSRR